MTGVELPVDRLSWMVQPVYDLVANSVAAPASVSTDVCCNLGNCKVSKTYLIDVSFISIAKIGNLLTLLTGIDISQFAF